jgi:orotate phosphoribosyltransferase
MDTTPKLTDQELASRLVATAYLRGTFRLRSGKYSDRYFDKFRFSSSPELLWEIALRMAKALPSDIGLVAGIELGGIPLCTALSLASGLPAVFVRKAKKDYGTEKLIEGCEIADRRVCIVEDVVTTGGQIVTTVDALREAGARVDHVLCVVNRGPTKNETLAAARLELRAVFQGEDLAPWMGS